MVGAIMKQIAGGLVVVTMAFVTHKALADEGCAPYTVIEKALADSKYHEHPVAHALTAGGALVVIFAGDKGRTWTVVAVRPADQMACLRGAGTDWQVMADSGQGS